MTEIPFHTTRMGRTYYEHTLPRIADELARVNATLVELLNAIERNGKPRWERPVMAPKTPITDHGAHVATPMNPKP